LPLTGQLELGHGLAADVSSWTDKTLYEETELEKGFMSILGFNEPGKSPRPMLRHISRRRLLVNVSRY
jgi:hypothetical protein